MSDPLAIRIHYYLMNYIACSVIHIVTLCVRCYSAHFFQQSLCSGSLVFAEAFITTYRTFITPAQLIEKLVQRYTLYCCQRHEQKAAKESFSLLVRVVNDLT